MHSTFAQLVQGLHPKCEQLIGMTPCRHGYLPKDIPRQGVYLFSEGAEHLYVGRSNNIRNRYGRHCNPGATHRMAAFAFKLARNATGKMIASYRVGEDSRKGLMLNLEFKNAFDQAKARIRRMDFRFVEETDQNAQALLEIYCTLALNARYNDFNTH
ncbi:hypothetical protein [Acidicapsa acidisoli]|uniref:hypothetical protein n=1 Tax=Acidicapsa acidisoli TaxID=1615681 RepID=UPI0021DF9883|nr:hypothetical protein [Acidicapsa acidisoli]